MKPLLEYRNWIYAIRQQSCQHVPNALARRVRFGPFLMRTRGELLSRLTQMQDSVKVELITPAELQRTKTVLDLESAAGVTKDIRRYEYVFENGKRVAALADFAVERTPRMRLGPLFMRKATLVDSRRVEADYSRLTRVAYYEVKS